MGGSGGRNINEREKHWLVASCMSPNQGWNPHHRCVPWPEWIIAFRQRGREREKHGLVAPIHAEPGDDTRPDRGWTHKLGMCSDQQPSGYRGQHSNQLSRTGQGHNFLNHRGRNKGEWKKGHSRKKKFTQQVNRIGTGWGIHIGTSTAEVGGIKGRGEAGRG